MVGVLSTGRFFASAATSIPNNAVVYELSLGAFEPEITDNQEVITYENNQPAS